MSTPFTTNTHHIIVGLSVNSVTIVSLQLTSINGDTCPPQSVSSNIVFVYKMGSETQEIDINFPEIYHKTQLNINITKIYYLNSHITLQIPLTIPHFLISQFKVKNFYFKAIVSFPYSLRPMEITWILGENTLCCMDGKGRCAMRHDQRGSYDQSKISWKAGRQVSLEAGANCITHVP